MIQSKRRISESKLSASPARSARLSNPGFVRFTKELTYLAACDVASEREAQSGRRTSQRWRPLRPCGACFASPPSTPPPRDKVYSVLVLAVLFNGSGVWYLHEDLSANFRSSHNRCCRAMCRVTVAHTRHFSPILCLAPALCFSGVIPDLTSIAGRRFATDYRRAEQSTGQPFQV